MDSENNFHDASDGPQRRHGLANIFENLSGVEISALQESWNQTISCEIQSLPGFNEATTRTRRNALANIFQTGLPDLNFESLNLNGSAFTPGDPQNQRHESFGSQDSAFTMSSASQISSNLSSSNSSYVTARQLSSSESMDEGFSDESAERQRRRRHALADIFEEIPLKNGFRLQYFQLIYESSVPSGSF